MRTAIRIRSWKHHPMLLVGGVLALGLVAFIAGPRSHAVRTAAAEPAEPAMTAVLAASHPLSAGSVISANDIKLLSVRGPLPLGSLLSKEDALGRVTGRGYAAGERISRDDLQDVSTLGIAARVLPGQRAFSIRVSEDEIVGGFLQSGDHVDVFATIPGSIFPTKDSTAQPDRSRTLLLLQDLLVLAVGENTTAHGSAETNARTVSLSLSPDALARMALAQRFGKVSLAIRGPGDNATAKSVSATLADIVPSISQPSGLPRKSAPRVPFYAGAHDSSLSWDGTPR